MNSVQQIRSDSPVLQQEEGVKPGKFQALASWVKENKKTIAVVCLIIGIAAVTFGIGAIAAAAAGASVAATVCCGGKGLAFSLVINKGLLISGAAAFLSGLFTMGFSSGYLAAAKN